jgi:cell wall assembly regulator SMI1
MPRFNTPNPVASESALRDFEATIGSELPADYREFLLQHNGGQPEDGVFSVPSWGTSVVQEFFGLGITRPGSSIEAALESVEEVLPEGVIPIGCEPGGVFLCIDLLGSKRGHIYLADFASSDKLYEVAPSFASFLATLVNSNSPTTGQRGEA